MALNLPELSSCHALVSTESITYCIIIGAEQSCFKTRVKKSLDFERIAVFDLI